MASLVFSDASGRQVVYPLDRDRVSIGRSGDNDIVSMDLRVSRRHAVITVNGEVCSIKDEASTLGVFVNRRRVTETTLRDGDVIEIGDSSYSFVDASTAGDAVTLSLSGLGAGVQTPSEAGLRGLAMVAELQEAIGSLRSTMGKDGKRDAPAQQSDFALVDARLDSLRQRLTRIERARTMMQTLYEVGRVLNSSYDRGNLLEIVLDQAVKVVRADRGFLTLYDPVTGAFERRATINMKADQGFSTSIALSVAQSGEPIITTDALSDERFRERQSVMDLNIRSALCVPLVNRSSKVMGVIYVDTRASIVTFLREDQEFLMAFANYASIAIENASLLVEAAARARAEEELRQARRMDEWKSQLISIVSHDVRTPLTSIMSYAEILHDDLETLEPARLRHFLDIINREADRLSRLVTNYLDWQKIEAGRMRLSLQRVDVGEMIQESMEALEGAAMHKKIRMEQDVAAALPEVLGDRDRLLQVLANLLSNAMKFTPEEGTVTIHATRTTMEERGEAVAIAVRDTGPGIPADKIEHLFQPFSQLDEQTRDQKRGTGLGLVLSRQIVSLHGGRIGVTSAPGRGSEFTMVLPVEGPSDAAGSLAV